LNLFSPAEPAANGPRRTVSERHWELQLAKGAVATEFDSLRGCRNQAPERILGGAFGKVIAAQDALTIGDPRDRSDNIAGIGNAVGLAALSLDAGLAACGSAAS
jgi:uncharacterized 2Fe-2S/4Fe-4S cluster protein (DUF4445 family)